MPTLGVEVDIFSSLDPAQNVPVAQSVLTEGAGFDWVVEEKNNHLTM